MKLIRYNKPLSWIIYHPHQGLWNWGLVRAIEIILPISPINKLAERIIVIIDTVIRSVRAFARRLSSAGLKGLIGSKKIPGDINILYFDLGTHKEARELSLMVDKILPRIGKNFKAYGFEAGREFFDEAQKMFITSKDVQIVHGALCHVLPSSGKIKLYKGKGQGLGSSIYRSDLIEFEEVEAIRLSDWLRENNLDMENSICLLRMNIEGSEFDVISDLVESGFAGYIDGYFGMWDDISKIDKNRDDEFRAFLVKNNVSPFTFNGRDLQFPFRVRCIEYDINTAVIRGLRRIREDSKKNSKMRG